MILSNDTEKIWDKIIRFISCSPHEYKSSEELPHLKKGISKKHFS